MQASRDNEFAALLELLDPDAVVRADDAALAMGGEAGTRRGPGGGGVLRRPCPGGAAGDARRRGGRLWQLKGEIKVVFGFTVVDGRVREIELLADPDVLTRAARRSLSR